MNIIQILLGHNYRPKIFFYWFLLSQCIVYHGHNMKDDKLAKGKDKSIRMK